MNSASDQRRYSAANVEPVAASTLATPCRGEQHQLVDQLGPVTIDAPSQEQIRAAPVAVAPEQVGGEVVIHHELVMLGPREEGADAIVDVRRGETVEVLGEVRDRLVEPSLLFRPRLDRLAVVQRLAGVDHRVHVLVGEDRRE